MTWSELQSVLQNGTTFLITSHVAQDGDCVGSQLAFGWYLRLMGKQYTIYDGDPVPEKFRFLPGTDAITTTRPEGTFDVLVVLDCSNPERLGWKGFDRVAAKTINIDHHRDNTRFADINIVDERASATAQLLYDFFTRSALTIPPEVAGALYSAILTDTGGFRFSNTNAVVLRICSELAELGANCSEIYRTIYDSQSRNGLKLRSQIWSTLQFHHNGKICSLEMPLKLISELGADYSDAEGMADFTVVARGVDVGIFIKYTDTETHFSLRSRGAVDVGRIAQRAAGGGGHGNAAGCTMALPLDRAKKMMLDILAAELGGG